MMDKVQNSVVLSVLYIYHHWNPSNLPVLTCIYKHFNHCNNSTGATELLWHNLYITKDYI
jgi:hypothetical protein